MKRWAVPLLLLLACVLNDARAASPTETTLCVDPCPYGAAADGIIVYVATHGQSWSVEADVAAEMPTTCATFTHAPLTFGALLFYIATAYNAAGESSTEHGSWAGEGYDPGPLCEP